MLGRRIQRPLEDAGQPFLGAGLDLDEEAEVFIEELHALGPDAALSDSQWRHIFALCHRTGEIERYVDFK